MPLADEMSYQDTAFLAPIGNEVHTDHGKVVEQDVAGTERELDASKLGLLVKAQDVDVGLDKAKERLCVVFDDLDDEETDTTITEDLIIHLNPNVK